MIATNPESPISTPQRLTEIPLGSLLGMTSLFLVAFGNLITLPDSDQDTTTSLDMQSLLKLAMIGLLSLYVLHRLWIDARVARVLFAVPGILLLSICLLLVVTCAVSNRPLVSLASALSTCACAIGAVAAGIQFGAERVMRLGFWACNLFLAASVLYWVVSPQSAMFAEPLDRGQFQMRYAGLSHPNTVGQYAAMALVMLFAWFLPSIQGRRGRWLGWMVGVLAAGSLIAAMSRTAILALIISLVFAFRKSIFRGRSLVALLCLSTLAVGGLAVLAVLPQFSERIGATVIKAISKSGEANELTTGTGRNEIWAESLRLIMERPFTGYGAATSKDLLKDFTRYTHNMVLNVSLSAGVFAGLLLLSTFAVGFRNAFQSPRLAADSLFACIFLNGMAENVCFQVIDSAPMVLMTIALVWRNVESIRSESTTRNDLLATNLTNTSWRGVQT